MSQQTNEQLEKIWIDEFKTLCIDLEKNKPEGLEEFSFHYWDTIDGVPVRIFYHDKLEIYLAARKKAQEEIDTLTMVREQYASKDRESIQIIQSLKDELKTERECVDIYADYRFGFIGHDKTKTARETKAKREIIL